MGETGEILSSPFILYADYM